MNPVVAVLLGWLLASEPLNMRIVVAGALIIAAIMFVGRGTKDEIVQQKPSSGGHVASSAPDKSGELATVAADD